MSNTRRIPEGATLPLVPTSVSEKIGFSTEDAIKLDALCNAIHVFAHVKGYGCDGNMKAFQIGPILGELLSEGSKLYDDLSKIVAQQLADGEVTIDEFLAACAKVGGQSVEEADRVLGVPRGSVESLGRMAIAGIQSKGPFKSDVPGDLYQWHDDGGRHHPAHD